MGQCVMTAGTMKMPLSSAHSLDSHNMVHKIHLDYVKMFTYFVLTICLCMLLSTNVVISPSFVHSTYCCYI